MLTMMNPANERELTRLVQDAAAAGRRLEIIGGSSKSHIGRPMQTDGSISTRTMRGIPLYEPTEHVMSAKAGTPLFMIEAELASANQMLAFEPIDLGLAIGAQPHQMTIGAVFATNFSGSRRILAGSARDHLLGLRAVNGRGEAFKSGGRVLKNVAGYDLSRGLSGSWGTLAVLTETTFKVMAKPEETRTVIFPGLPDEIAVEVMSAALATPYEVSGTIHLQTAMVARLWHQRLRDTKQSITALRVENFSNSVGERAARLNELLSVYGYAEELGNADSLAFWDEIRQVSFLQGSTDPVWRISTAPNMGPRIVRAISGYMDCKAVYDWSGGLLWLEVLPTADAGSADIRRVIAINGGHATLIRAEPSVRAGIDVFQPLEPGLDRLTRRLKSAFDPAGVFNPGRMYAHI